MVFGKRVLQPPSDYRAACVLEIASGAAATEVDIAVLTYLAIIVWDSVTVVDL